MGHYFHGSFQVRAVQLPAAAPGPVLRRVPVAGRVRRRGAGPGVRPDGALARRPHPLQRVRRAGDVRAPQGRRSNRTTGVGRTRKGNKQSRRGNFSKNILWCSFCMLYFL